MDGLYFLFVVLIGVGVIVARVRIEQRDRRENEQAAAQGLEAQIALYISRGYRLMFRDATTAQMLQPKRFSFLWAFAWFLLFGIGLVVYLIYYLSKRDKTMYLRDTQFQVASPYVQPQQFLPQPQFAQPDAYAYAQPQYAPPSAQSGYDPYAGRDLYVDGEAHETHPFPMLPRQSPPGYRGQ